ncbi:MAG: hypothetical protein WDZ27_05560 [Waddliaceae bacterium]
MMPDNSFNINKLHIVNRDTIQNMPYKKEAQVVEHNGRLYEVYTIQKEIQPKISFIRKIWNFLLSRKVKPIIRKIVLAVDASSEKKVTTIALKHGLIPQLTNFKIPGYIWSAFSVSVTKTIDTLNDQEELVTTIKERQGEIASQRENFRPKIIQEQNDENKKGTYESIAKLNTLKPVEGGAGGAYLLLDSDQKAKFIVKPNDEDAFTLNNRKRYAMPLKGQQYRVRPDIPSYESAQNETLSSDIAGLAGLREIIPLTVLAILKNDQFHLLTDSIESEDFAEELIDQNGREKLCSVQEFVDQSEDLVDFQQRMQKEGQPVKFDQNDFEMANLLVWVTGEQDGHSGNFRTYTKEDGSIGLKKIDSGLICGEGGEGCEGIVNGLTIYHDQMERPLSNSIKQKIRDIPVDEIVDRMQFLGKSDQAIYALKGRVKMIQKLVSDNELITLKEINQEVIKHYTGYEEVSL